MFSVDSNSSAASSIPEEDEEEDEESNLLLTFTVNWGEAVRLEIVDSVLIDPFGLVFVVLGFFADSSVASSFGRFFLLGLLLPPCFLLPPDEPELLLCAFLS